jgi:ferritin-like protein
MNEQIKELAEQAEISRLEYNPYTMMTERIQEFDKQKFAELIVRECMRMCDCADVSLLEHNRPQEASGASSVKQFIAEHFGVEE